MRWLCKYKEANQRYPLTFTQPKNIILEKYWINDMERKKAPVCVWFIVCLHKFTGSSDSIVLGIHLIEMENSSIGMV